MYISTSLPSLSISPPAIVVSANAAAPALVPHTAAPRTNASRIASPTSVPLSVAMRCTWSPPPRKMPAADATSAATAGSFAAVRVPTIGISMLWTPTDSKSCRQAVAARAGLRDAVVKPTSGAPRSRTGEPDEGA